MSALRCAGERSSICGKALRASARYRGSVVVVNTFIAANSGTTTPFTCPSSVSEPTILTTPVSCAIASRCSTLTGSPLFPLLNTTDVHSSDSILLGIPLEPELRGRRHVAGERGCGHDGRTRQVALAADAHAVLPVAVERRDRALPLL